MSRCGRSPWKIFKFNVCAPSHTNDHAHNFWPSLVGTYCVVGLCHLVVSTSTIFDAFLVVPKVNGILRILQLMDMFQKTQAWSNTNFIKDPNFNTLPWQSVKFCCVSSTVISCLSYPHLRPPTYWYYKTLSLEWINIMMVMMNLKPEACHVYNMTFQLVLTWNMWHAIWKNKVSKLHLVLDNRAHEAPSCCIISNSYTYTKFHPNQLECNTHVFGNRMQTNPCKV